LYFRIVINGVVQGIGFRPFVYNIALKNHLTGFVLNRGDAGVEIQVKGSNVHIKNFIQDLKTLKPSLAKYELFTSNQLTDIQENSLFDSFQISKSSLEKGNEGSYIPPDLPICEKCIKEIYSDPRRNQYPFTSCVDCGPRYSVITSLPYDRPRTVMDRFPLCPDCMKEYTDPSDRRFHAQTTCCWKCGPRYYLADNKGNIVFSKIDLEKNWSTIPKLLNEDKILAIKGIGGTHIACRTLLDDPIFRIRQWKGARGEKPFAVMSKDRETVRKFAKVSDSEYNLLKSLIRPILLLNKSETYSLSEYISPSLHNIGVLLPYAGIHHLMLDGFHDPALVMTSGNPSNIPILVNNSKIKENLSNVVDYFLLHDREIYQRVDDSVIRIHSTIGSFFPQIIRRSRGYVPEPIRLPWKSKPPSVIALGAEMHAVGSVGIGNRVFPTQHIGHLSSIENIDFLQSSLAHIRDLMNLKEIEAIGGDLHPEYSSTILGKELSKDLGVPFMQFQHHHSHLSSLAIDTGIDIDEDIICATLDGTGYGSDGTIWGGEILLGNFSNYRRLAHLERINVPGGDLAIKEPHRGLLTLLLEAHTQEKMKSALLNIPWLKWIPETEQYDLLVLMLKKKLASNNSPKQYTSSSCGRVLDIISILLGAAKRRTYEGEPAIKLESLASKVKYKRKLPQLDLQTKNGNKGMIEILTRNFILELWERVQRGNNRYLLATAAQVTLANKLANICIQLAEEHGVKKIGISGGVCYNQTIFREFYQSVLNAGKDYEFIYHKKIPCGDGGISIGQIPLIQAKMM
jgi:hydrogenase maturation protein HypF